MLTCSASKACACCTLQVKNCTMHGVFWGRCEGTGPGGGRAGGLHSGSATSTRCLSACIPISIALSTAYPPWIRTTLVPVGPALSQPSSVVSTALTSAGERHYRRCLQAQHRRPYALCFPAYRPPTPCGIEFLCMAYGLHCCIPTTGHRPACCSSSLS
jgi:hypothetical protein